LAIKLLSDLIKDIEKEVTLAVGKDFSFAHWGRHYLPSLCHAHQN